MIISKLPENQFHVSGLNVFQVNNRISIFVFFAISFEERSKVSGTDGEDKLVSVEVDGLDGRVGGLAGQGDVRQEFSPAKLFDRTEENGVVVVPL